LLLSWLVRKQDRSCVCAVTTPMPRTTKTKSNPRRHPRSLPQNNQPCFVGRFGCPSARARCKDLGICALGIQSSATRKHKCLVGGVRPVVSHESEEPRRSNTPGFFLGNAHGIHSSHASSVRVVVAWRRPAQRHIQFPNER